ncbi:MAG: C-GCAxxG-C-C family protein [Treponema sp.]|nr:C-GCAxxG-C-C family protein [Treponema sp.]
MSRAETAVKYFDVYNCAQSTLAAYADDYGLEKDKALQAAVGFGGGIGRLQDVCGAVSAAVIVLGLASGFKEDDGRPKINAVYDTVRRFVAEFTREKGTIKCSDLLNCDLSSEEGQKYFKEHNLKEQCRSYVRLCCELLDAYIAEGDEPSKG